MTELAVRQRVCEFWRKNSGRGKLFTVSHFVSEGYHRSTIYALLTKFEKDSDMSRKPGSGGHNKKLSTAQRASIGRWLKDKRGVSLRQEAKKYGVSHQTMCNIMRERGLKCYKRTKAPQYTADQEYRAKVRAGKLHRILGDKKIIMDDEAYFKLKCDYLPGNDHYFASSVESAPSDVKYRTEKKFPVQLMVWLCVSENGVSEPVFLERPNSVNAEFYQEHCVRRGLMSFIKKYHDGDDILFWPDLASAHYARTTLQILRDLDVPFVEKECNPPNLPQCRPIENFWGLLKTAVYDKGWEANSIPQLKRRITATLKKMDHSPLRADLRTLKTRLRTVNREGPFSILRK